MEAAATKSSRLLQTREILLACQQGTTRSEIARRLGINRSTAKRYIDELSRQIPIWEDGNLVGINRDDYKVDVQLTMHESMAIHLATRLMATWLDKHNRHAASALRQLGRALEKLTPRISQHLLASAQVMDDAGQRHDPNYLRILEILTQAWSQERMVHLWHKQDRTGRIFEYDFAPYFIEPYAIGRTTHVIGMCKKPAKRLTFKVERIERVELIDETYAIPADFDPETLLSDAWGIWYTDAEPVQVVLKFHPRVAGRVKETRWHRNEETVDLPDGYLLWRAWIAEPQEMIPWVRGWGADVEIREPEELRNELKAEARRLARIYGWRVSSETSTSTDQDYDNQRFRDIFG